MAEVEEEGEPIICEDEEDIQIDIDSDDEDDWDGDSEDADGNADMYDSPLDQIDEVLHFHNQLTNLQNAGGQELHNFLMSQLAPEEHQQL